MKQMISILNTIDLPLYGRICSVISSLLTIYTYCSNTPYKLWLLVVAFLLVFSSLIWDINEKVEHTKYTLLQMFFLKKTYHRVSSLLAKCKKH